MIKMSLPTLTIQCLIILIIYEFIIEYINLDINTVNNK